MDMFKKFILVWFLLSFVSIYNNLSAADNNDYQYRKEASKKYVNYIKNWDLVIKKIDIFVNKYDNDKLKKILNRLPSIKSKFNWKNIFVYNYLEASIQIKLNSNKSYINNSESIIKTKNKEDLKTAIEKISTEETKILYFWAYESSSSDNNISVDLDYNKSPVIVVLSSFKSVTWKVSNINSNIKAIVINCYEDWYKVLIDKKVDIYSTNTIAFEYYLEPIYYSINWELHYENYWISKLNESVNDIFWKNVYWFKWEYAIDKWTLPETIITDEKLNEYMKIYEEIEEKNKEETKPINKLFWDNSKTTWWKYINPTDDIPTWEFKAFYFDSTNPTEIVLSENVTNISYNWNEFLWIPPENYWAYYVWYFDFPEDETKIIQYNISWSEIRISIDDKIIIPDLDTWDELVYNFKKWKHKIEIEYLNNRMWINYTFIIKWAEEANISKNDLDNEIIPLLTEDTKILYFWVYTSSSEDNNISVNVNYDSSPAIIVLTSYEPVNWNINNLWSNIKAIVYSSYSNWGIVKTDRNVNIYYTKSIPSQYENVYSVFWKSIYWFNWWYSLDKWMLPWKILNWN